jgi:superfamily II DNA or RNA helicase
VTSPPFPPLVKSSRAEGFRAVFGTGFFGYQVLFSASLPDRVYVGFDEARRPPAVLDEPTLDATALTTPTELLSSAQLPDGLGWPTATRKTIARAETLWLLLEDKQRLLDAQAIDALPHQAALVEHVLSTAGLERVLIADEVGLGKTIEVALIIQRLQDVTPSLKVLYLTEARLVPNVVEEFDRVGLSPRPRVWTADRPEARLTPGDSDAMVVASIHKAVANAEMFARAGPWDVLVVDEAHHLTDYSEEGGDPQERMKLVRKLVAERLTPGGRLLLLSGTPHQGHVDRFKNLLRLLSARNDERDAAGKVIYRIKDDILGWNGEPLFPLREVHPHRAVSVDASYHEWMTDVNELLTPGPGSSRASAWRRAQALQHCASSPEAGLAYLTRLALRAGRRSSDRPVRNALQALRPYRDGTSAETVENLEQRLRHGGAELEQDEGDVFSGGEMLLNRVLVRGTELVTDDAFGQKLRSLTSLIDEAGNEKFVVFAQPVETVYTLRRRLEVIYGKDSIAFIVGGQKPEARSAQIRRFVSDPNVLVMVSSKSGGEGINLQVSRRLVHFDVPWNPMEMEQRVGRVHRYGGSRTIIVDTLVLEGSREMRVLDRARARLGAIVKDLDSTRFELLFSRTMAAIPYEELVRLMEGEQFAPLEESTVNSIDAMIQRSLEQYRETEKQFRARDAALKNVERGEVGYSDLESWIARHGGGTRLEGFKRRVLADQVEAGRVSTLIPANIYALEDGSFVFFAPEAGIGVQDAHGRHIDTHRMGLNMAPLAQKVRDAIDEGNVNIGAGALLVKRIEWDEWCRRFAPNGAHSAGGVLMLYMARGIEQSATPPERGVSFCGWLVTEETESALRGAALGDMMRLVRDPRPKQKPTVNKSQVEIIGSAERRHLELLRVCKPGEPVAAVFPIAALQIEVD